MSMSKHKKTQLRAKQVREKNNRKFLMLAAGMTAAALVIAAVWLVDWQGLFAPEDEDVPRGTSAPTEPPELENAGDILPELPGL
ncbi:MAG: hypothetical protein FWG45_01825 [Oscillospiraceae bacterium]|nr:hypothetical protein [Oscillospiraceae bacterium]